MPRKCGVAYCGTNATTAPIASETTVTWTIVRTKSWFGTIIRGFPSRDIGRGDGIEYHDSERVLRVRAFHVARATQRIRTGVPTSGKTYSACDAAIPWVEPPELDWDEPATLVGRCTMNYPSLMKSRRVGGGGGVGDSQDRA